MHFYMKKVCLIFVFVLLPFYLLAMNEEPEKASPSHGITLYRDVSRAYINGSNYRDVEVSLKAAASSTGVKVVVMDTSGSQIYKKRFSNSFLYGFSDGTIQVGNGNALTQIWIRKVSGDWVMDIKEKGIY